MDRDPVAAATLDETIRLWNDMWVADAPLSAPDSALIPSCFSADSARSLPFPCPVSGPVSAPNLSRFSPDSAQIPP